MTRQPNSKYWNERSIERLAAVERGTPKYLNEIQQMYESAAREIRENIAGIIGNYAKNADLTVTEAFEILRTPVTAEEIEKLKVIAGSIPDKIERAKALARLNAPAYAARISRQQAVLESTRLELAKLAPGQVQTMTTALMEAAHESFNRTVFDIQQGFGLGYTFNQVSSGQIEEVLKQKWSGRHYSKRVWDNTEVLADRVKSVIKQNMITGRSWRRSLDEVNDIVKSGGLYSAKRLLQTETAYVANEMEAEAYEDADIDEYEFVATLDGRTSQICQEKDGKIYKLKDRKPGVNYPPLHAHCRSTTVAVVEGFDTSELKRRARDPVTGKNVLVPADMKYPEWKKNATIGTVKLPDGSISKLSAGTSITKIVPFAGKGANKTLRLAESLAKDYNNSPDDWSHSRGEGFVDFETESKRAELHWFEHEEVGRILMKVKRWF